MKNLITYDQKHLLWQDEQGHTFLITKHCEIFIHSNDTLRCLSWSYLFPTTLVSNGLISSFCRTDDGLYDFQIKTILLPSIIAIDGFKKRPDINGKFIRTKKQILGHEIKPYYLPYERNPKKKYINNINNLKRKNEKCKKN